MHSKYYKRMSEQEFREAIINEFVRYEGVDSTPYADQTHISVDGDIIQLTPDTRRVWYKGRLVYEKRA